MTRLSRHLLDGTITIRPTAPKTRPAATPVERFNRRQRREVSRLRRLHDTLSERVAVLVQSVDSLKEISEAAAALDRLGRITDRLVEMERHMLGLDAPAALLGDDFARLLKNAWERAYGTTPPDFDPIP